MAYPHREKEFIIDLNETRISSLGENEDFLWGPNAYKTSERSSDSLSANPSNISGKDYAQETELQEHIQEEPANPQSSVGVNKSQLQDRLQHSRNYIPRPENKYVVSGSDYFSIGGKRSRRKRPLKKSKKIKLRQ